MVGLKYMGLPSFPHPIFWKVGRVSSEMAEAPDSRCADWRQYPRLDATVGVLTVPLNALDIHLGAGVYGVALRIVTHLHSNRSSLKYSKITPDRTKKVLWPR